MQEVQRIIEWNIIAGNTAETFNRHLEASMFAEEAAEVIIALKENNKVELVDGIIDTFIVGVGILHKQGFTAEMISNCFNEILNSNNSKFTLIDGKLTAIKDSTGKIQKGENYFKPNLEQYL